MRVRLPQAIGNGHGAARVLVVPGAIADRDAAFTVAGCSAYVLGARSVRGPRPRRKAAGMSATPSWAGPALGGARPVRRHDARLPLVAARMPAFLLLAAFGASAWGRMVEPDASGAMVAGALQRARRRRRARRRGRAQAVVGGAGGGDRASSARS